MATRSECIFPSLVCVWGHQCLVIVLVAAVHAAGLQSCSHTLHSRDSSSHTKSPKNISAKDLYVYNERIEKPSTNIGDGACGGILATQVFFFSPALTRTGGHTSCELSV